MGDGVWGRVKRSMSEVIDDLGGERERERQSRETQTDNALGDPIIS